MAACSRHFAPSGDRTEGIAFSPDEKDGNISTAELNLWLTTQVRKLTQNRQNAVMVKPDTVPDFSIARLKQ